ncbi:MAG: glycosyl hydrolase family 57, partial [Halochromatium sp.]
MSHLPEHIDGLPNICGQESTIEQAMQAGKDQSLAQSPGAVDFGSIRAACAIALHQHQPLIPAGGDDLQTATIISNLKYMMDHQDIGDNYNAPAFVWCYKRIGEFIPQLIHEGKSPRVMLEYSGTLLHGLRQMGEDHVLDALKGITMNPDYNWA